MYESSGESVKTQHAGPHPRDSNSVGPGQGTLQNSLPGDAADACPWLNLEQHCRRAWAHHSSPERAEEMVMQ